MATTNLNDIQPVASVIPVASAPVITPPTITPAVPNPLLTSVNPDAVYSPTNIQQIDIPSIKKASSMKLADLEKKLSKANSIEELNQIGIMNQPKAMGVLTGEAAYRSRLDTARINAFNSLYNNRLVEEQRKEAERQQFISTYGADPKMRPSGMSKREFQKALAGGQFSNLLTTDYKLKQADLAGKLKSLSGVAGGSKELLALDNAYKQTGGDWGKTVELLQSNFDVSSGSVIDNELRRRNNLPPITSQTQTERIGAVAGEVENNIYGNINQDTGKVDLNTYLENRQRYVSSGGQISNYNNAYGSLLSDEDQKKAGVQIKQQTTSQSDLERAGWQWLASDEAKNMSDEEKAQELKSNGLDPAKFGIYAG